MTKKHEKLPSRQSVKMGHLNLRVIDCKNYNLRLVVSVDQQTLSYSQVSVYKPLCICFS